MVENGHVSNGLGVWFLAVPVGLACAILLPILFSLHPLWGLMIYPVAGVFTGMSLLVVNLLRTRSGPQISRSSFETQFH